MLAIGVGSLTFSACAASRSSEGPSTPSPRVLLLYGDGRPDNPLSFTDSAYEALVRFDLDPQAGQPRRLWYRPSAAGTFQVSVYASSALDGPGELLQQHQQVATQSVSWAADTGRWLVAELDGLEGSRTLWVGLKKLADSPGLWCSDRDAGHYYMRSLDPNRHVSLVPVRRAPLVQLELN